MTAHVVTPCPQDLVVSNLRDRSCVFRVSTNRSASPAGLPLASIARRCCLRTAGAAIGLVVALTSHSALAQEPIEPDPTSVESAESADLDGNDDSDSERPQAVDEGASDVPSPAGRTVVIRVVSQTGDDEGIARDEVLRVVTQAFVDAEYAIDEEADLLVQVLLNRPDEQMPGFRLEFGYSRSQGEPPRRALSYRCPRCSASELLERSETLAIEVIGKIEGADKEASAKDVGVKSRGPEAGPQHASLHVRRRSAQLRGERMWAAGIGLTLLGGAGVLATGTGAIIASQQGLDLPVATWVGMGGGATVAAVGIPLWIVGRRRKKNARIGLVHARSRGLLVLFVSGRF